MNPQDHRPALVMAAVCAITLFVYSAGLQGPFVFDDEANFAAISHWLSGQATWQHTLGAVDSGPGGRPLAVASFMLSALMGGVTPFAFKAGNVAIHIVNGVLVYALTRCLARRDPQFASRGTLAPLVLASFWLLSPLLVSTVLYAVQRMAMLSATFCLLGLLTYCHGRVDAEAGKTRQAAIKLLLGVPILTVLAAAAKENGLLLPLLCAVIEFFYFRPTSGARPGIVRAFTLLFVALPVLAGLALLVLRPSLVLAGYHGRDFTLTQRLLTESRILWDYVASILLPWGPRFSLYRDDYLVSTSLLAPATTLLAVLAWVALAAAAWRLRRTLPSLGAGLGLYLVGHAMESTVFPLLLYFEHRNYLPALGILWAAGGILVFAASRVAPHMTRPGTVFGVGMTLVLCAFTGATLARVMVWADKDALLASSLRAAPASRWLRMDLALTALRKAPPDFASARRHYAALSALPNPISRQIGTQGLVVTDCAQHGRVEGRRVDAAFEHSGLPIEPDQYQMIDLMGGLILRQQCAGLSAADLASRVDAWIGLSPTPESSRLKKNLRFLNAQLLASSGLYRPALTQATTSWRAGAREAPLGAMIIELHMALGELAEARRWLNAASTTLLEGDHRGAEVFTQLAAKLDEAQRGGTRE